MRGNNIRVVPEHLYIVPEFIEHRKKMEEHVAIAVFPANEIVKLKSQGRLRKFRPLRKHWTITREANGRKI